ncbi:MAG: glycosyltransferase family 2 protein [Desmonostoc vinosum HA7617-LM4]|jgi:glycosyltransferase involved in cell wall biosynthesis|nr:glycosyltransferase family 2 protein [Desmonostoc vinosum HA7617-LM4]
MNLFLSVIICTHNPRKDYILRVLASLESQTLPNTNWELLLIDNASEQLLASEIDLSWHPHARHVREEQLGLTPARLRGIQQAQTEVLVFVDDDNVLEASYLETAFRISKDFPLIGAWGGQVIPEFEVPPPAWAKPYLGNLAIREFERDQWSNLLHQHDTTPCGAGLCIRKVVGQKYAEMIGSDRKRINLDRRGKMLTSCGDSDLAFTACDIGLGTGMFTSLKLTHLIPKARLEENYLMRLVEGLAYSQVILADFRGQLSPETSWKSSKLYSLYVFLRFGLKAYRFHEAGQRGKKLAFQEIAK